MIELLCLKCITFAIDKRYKLYSVKLQLIVFKSTLLNYALPIYAN